MRTSQRHKPKLERTTFETSRAAEYFDARQLSTLTGVPKDEFASVCLKELVDNALDACETAGVAPVVCVQVERDAETIRLTVSDNGPGIPPEVVKKVLDYNIRVSDKAAYRSPTRGAQGNALKTVIGIPYALGSREPLMVAARGVRHSIAPWVDPAGVVHFDYANTPLVTEGTTISLTIPNGEIDDEDDYYLSQDFDPLHWVRSFVAFNPHATVSYQAKDEGSNVAEIYKSTLEDIKKYVPSEPTSPHWYSAASLKGLVLTTSHTPGTVVGTYPLASSSGSFRGSPAPRRRRLWSRR